MLYDTESIVPKKIFPVNKIPFSFSLGLHRILGVLKKKGEECMRALEIDLDDLIFDEGDGLPSER